MTIRQATKNDINQLGQLFAEYRVFYKQNYELEKSIDFLTKRFKNSDSIIIIAIDGNEYAGFVQLYPSFTSVGMKEIWILNDLYVNDKHRQKGIAQALIENVLEYSKKTNRRKVVLSTAHDNYDAQKLYEKLGFNQDKFYNYEKITE